MDFAARRRRCWRRLRRAQSSMACSATTSRPRAQVDAVVRATSARKFAWTIESEWIVWLPGLVSGLNVACRAVGDPGDAVFTATPIYPPFLSAHRSTPARRVVSAPLVRDSAWLAVGFPGGRCGTQRAARRSCSSSATRTIRPAAPGREDELWQVAALAEKHDVVVCSDEIHNGLVLSTVSAGTDVFATLSPEVAARSITLLAPSKTFNIPGLGCAFAVISDPALRRRFHAAHARHRAPRQCARHGGERQRR
jgi:cystathionine beta-lyase